MTSWVRLKDFVYQVKEHEREDSKIGANGKTSQFRQNSKNYSSNLSQNVCVGEVSIRLSEADVQMSVTTMEIGDNWVEQRNVQLQHSTGHSRRWSKLIEEISTASTTPWVANIPKNECRIHGLSLCRSSGQDSSIKGWCECFGFFFIYFAKDDDLNTKFLDARCSISSICFSLLPENWKKIEFF